MNKSRVNDGGVEKRDSGYKYLSGSIQTIYLAEIALMIALINGCCFIGARCMSKFFLCLDLGFLKTPFVVFMTAETKYGSFQYNLNS